MDRREQAKQQQKHQMQMQMQKLSQSDNDSPQTPLFGVPKKVSHLFFFLFLIWPCCQFKKVKKLKKSN